MAQPDNIVLGHVRAVRADVADVKHRLESKAEAAQIADLDSKLSGLTHVVMSSLGSVVQSLDKRVAAKARAHLSHARDGIGLASR